MKILRTDSGGESFTNDRLRTLRQMLMYFDIKNIYMLHDHKGILTVIWDSAPEPHILEKVIEAWNYFNEDLIEHKLVKFINL